MKIDEAKQKFIQTWGALGSSWGVNRTMASIHALLLISPEPMSADQVMETLQISRGNANMNLRALIDWGLVHRDLVPGERKEFFIAEKDIWKVARQVMKERRKREIEPLMNALEEFKNVEGDKREKEVKEFVSVITEIEGVVTKADKTMQTVIKMDEHWFVGTFMKLMK
jgi:DNA-binding transcriptional regulator GbsR (MarR family)